MKLAPLVVLAGLASGCVFLVDDSKTCGDGLACADGFTCVQKLCVPVGTSSSNGPGSSGSTASASTNSSSTGGASTEGSTSGSSSGTTGSTTATSGTTATTGTTASSSGSGSSGASTTGAPGTWPCLNDSAPNFVVNDGGMGLSFAPTSVRAGRFTRRGADDLIVFGQNSFAVLPRNGAGFDPPTSVNPVAGRIGGVGVGDFNHDGLPDVAFTASGGITVYLNVDGGAFSAQPQISEDSPSNIVVGDLNHDGKLDLAVNDSSSASIYIYNGIGDGSFGDGGVYAGCDTSAHLSIADFNGDGRPDLLETCGGDGTVLVLNNEGDAGFSDGATFSGFSPAPDIVVTADFDRDGKPDLLVGTVAPSAVYVALSSQGYQPASVGQLGPGRITGLSATDVNGDGIPDILVGIQPSSAQGVVLVFLDDDGEFTSLPPVTFLTASLGGFTTTDLDGNGTQDILAAENDAQAVGLAMNQPGAPKTGELATPISVTAGAGTLAPEYLAVGDLDGDGRLDLACALQSTAEETLLASGPDSFSEQPLVTDFTKPSAIAMGDTDGDGRLQVVVTDSQDGFVWVGSDLVDGGQTFDTGLNPVGVALGDLNGDGHLDIATANSGDATSDDGSLGILFWDPVEGFVDGGVYGGFAAQPSAVVIGDFNEDGWPDVAMVDHGDANVHLYLNDHSGGFNESLSEAVPHMSSAVALATADLDGDGHLDLVIASGSSAGIIYLRGDGAGSFDPHDVQPTHNTGSLNSVALVDLDGDGHLDVVATIQGANSGLAIYLNDGGGELSPVTFIPGFSLTSVVAGDFDRNGTMDLAAASGDPDSVQIYSNVCH